MIMQRLIFSAIGVLGLALLPLGTGCGDKANTSNNNSSAANTNVPKTGGPKGGTAATSIAPGDGVITGKVVFAGTEPEKKILEAIVKYDTGLAPDKCCKSAGGVDDSDNRDQTWIIGEKKGVANVVVFLKAPKGQYFAASDADKKRTSKVTIDQPHCAFKPHVAGVFLYYKDGNKTEKTGEVLEVINDAKFLHNTRTTVEGNEVGSSIDPGKHLDFDLPPDTKPYKLSCNAHQFMQGLVWSFDHPYFFVTKDDGTFEIKGVPTDVPLDFYAWHEGSSAQNGFFEKKEAITVKKGTPTNLGELSVK
jgi:hypothetical protein